MLLIDADPQGSAVEWVKNAPALPFQAVSAPHLDSLALVPDAERFVGPDQADLEAMIAGMGRRCGLTS